MKEYTVTISLEEYRKLVEELITIKDDEIQEWKNYAIKLMDDNKLLRKELKSLKGEANE